MMYNVEGLQFCTKIYIVGLFSVKKYAKCLPGKRIIHMALGLRLCFPVQYAPTSFVGMPIDDQPLYKRVSKQKSLAFYSNVPI